MLHKTLQRYHRRLGAQRGMTLVELLAVVVLIGIIMAVVVKGISARSESAKANLNVVKMSGLKNLISTYRSQYLSYPARLEDLLVASPEVKKSGKLFTPLVSDEEELKDVWGFPFIYKAENNGRSYSLTSLGADGVEGGENENTDVTVKP